MKKKLINSFKNPESEYRGAPFWAWNGKLDPEELRRQIRIMHKMGLGGFFMHSRVGLDTKYLSDEWFECIKACVDEAEKLDMQAWLYDEDRWPSGAAGGLVTKNREYRAKSLVMEELKKADKFEWTNETLRVFKAVIKDNKASNIQKVSKKDLPAKLKKGETLLHFYIHIHEDNSWYNNQAYLDTLDKDAVKEFIKVTHEAYRKELGDALGKRVPGIFTDEPNHPHVCWPTDAENKTDTAWTRTLPEVFKKRYGYDITEKLVEIFYDIEGQEVSKVRWNYHDCLTHLFVTAFAKQIGEWCDKNNMLHTGHVLEEDTLSIQTKVVGSAMRFYEYMQAPGMDLLTERWEIYETAKQVSSAANQFGRKWRLTETYGCTGWDFPFMGHKALGDWQAALGINLRCQHLSWYTMEGEAKRDYPASISYQSPWWEEYSKVEDYFGRINTLMSEGTEVRDILVIHPIESMWTMVCKGWGLWEKEAKEVTAYNKMFMELRNTLLSKSIDFDLGDEEILSRHGKVSGSGDSLRVEVAKASYKAVVVPPLVTMRATTLNLLKDFKAAGGTVIFAGKPAAYIDAEASGDAIEFAKECTAAPAKGEKLSDLLDGYRRISIADANGKEIDTSLYILREDTDAYYLFACNTGHKDFKFKYHRDDSLVRDRKEAFPEVTISAVGNGKEEVLELDPDTGDIFAADAKFEDSAWKISTSFEELGSRLFVINKKKQNEKYPARKKLKTSSIKKLKNEKWNVILSEDNVLALDFAKYKIGGGKWKAKKEILQLDCDVRDALGIQHRGGSMCQPWAREIPKNPKRIEVELKYSFNLKEIPTGALFLAIERPETFTISVNGNPLESDMASGWWTDRSLKKLTVSPSFLKKGENEITMVCDYDETHSGFEIVYLLGSFGVKLNKTEATITAPVKELKIGDWVNQGLAFYSGSASYCKTIKPSLKKGERLFVRVPEYRGAGVKIIVDGVKAGVIAWEPNEIDITDLVKKDSVEIQIELLGTRRNSHGPLHCSQKWPNWTGPDSYKSFQLFDKYQLVPCGIMKDPELIIKK